MSHRGVVVLVLLACNAATAWNTLGDVLLVSKKRSCTAGGPWHGLTHNGCVIGGLQTAFPSRCCSADDGMVGMQLRAEGWTPSHCSSPRLFVRISSAYACRSGEGTEVELTRSQPCFESNGYTFWYGWSELSDDEVCDMLTYHHHAGSLVEPVQGTWARSGTCDEQHRAQRLFYDEVYLSPTVGTCGAVCPNTPTSYGKWCCRATAGGSCWLHPGYSTRYITCSNGEVQFAVRESESSDCESGEMSVFTFNRCVKKEGTSTMITLPTRLPHETVCRVVSLFSRHGFHFNNYIPLPPHAFEQYVAVLRGRPVPDLTTYNTHFISGVFKQGNCRRFVDGQYHQKLGAALAEATEAKQVIDVAAGCGSVVFSAQVEMSGNRTVPTGGEARLALNRVLQGEKYADLRDILQTPDAVMVSSERPISTCGGRRSLAVEVAGRCSVVGCKAGYHMQFDETSARYQCAEASDDDLSTSAIIAIACVCGAVGIAAIVTLLWCCCRNGKAENTNTKSVDNDIDNHVPNEPIEEP